MALDAMRGNWIGILVETCEAFKFFYLFCLSINGALQTDNGITLLGNGITLLGNGITLLGNGIVPSIHFVLYHIQFV